METGAHQKGIPKGGASLRRLSAEGHSTPTAAAHYLIRLVLACFGLTYFGVAGAVRETLPIPLGGVLVLVGAYAAANVVLLFRRRSSAAFNSAYVVVMLDLAMLLVIVLQDPYPSSPVTILLLSATFDLGQRFAPRVFSTATALAFCILLFNIWARLQAQQLPMPADGIWLTLSIGALMAYFYAASLAASASRTERRRIAIELQDLQQREQLNVNNQLRIAKFCETLRIAAMHREDFAEQVLRSLVAEIGACAAVLHELVESGHNLYLRPLSTYAMDLTAIRVLRVEMGEGLVGTCARQQKPIVLNAVPEGYFDLVSGLGQGSPQHLYLLPLCFSTQLAGVLELATMEPLQKSEMKLLEGMLEAFAGTLLLVPRNAAPTDIA